MPQTRTPDAHFFTEVRYKGAKTVAVTPDYSEVAKLADIWMHPKQGTDAAVAMAMGHVILKEFYFPDGGKERSAYFDDYARRYTDLPMLVMLKEHTLPDGARRHGARPLRARVATSTASSARPTTRSGRRVAFDEAGKVVLPNGAIGFRWGPDGRADQGQWNLEAKEARHGARREAQAVGAGRRARRRTTTARSASRTSAASSARTSRTTCSKATCWCARVPVQRIALGKAGDEREALVATVFDLQVAQLRRRARPAGRAAPRRASTTTRPTRRPGRSASPACRARS